MSGSYHGQPVIKEPVWTWEIPCYFFTGGLAGGSAGLGFLAGLRGNEVLARRAWVASFAGVALSPALLVSDLGRASRFLNMLRMFKVTSPMSVGSWILSASGLTTTVAAADALTGRLPRAGAVARPAAALLGLPLSTYTAALIANTSVPVWHEARRQLPFVFGSGALLSAGAAAIATTPVADAAPARRLAVASAVAELALSEAMERSIGMHKQAYEKGAPALFRRLSRALVAGGALLVAARGGRSRAAAVAGGAALAAGALSARWSIFKAGFQSASSPEATVKPQRERIESGASSGAARRTTAAPAEGGSPARSEAVGA